MRSAAIVGLVVAALVVLGAARARADATEIHVELTDVTIYGDGAWGLTSHDGGWEYWRNADGDVRREVTFGFSPAMSGPCPDRPDVANDAYAFEGDTQVWDEGESNGMSVTTVCTQVGDSSYVVSVALPGASSTLLMSFYAPVLGMVHQYVSRVRARGAAPVGDPPVRYDSDGEVATDHPSSGAEGGFDHSMTDPSPGGFGRWLRPHTIAVGVVRRSDGAGDTGWGAGGALSRLPWRGEEHFGIGYEVAVAGAEDWLAASAQLRPGMWVGTDPDSRILDRRGVAVNGYLAAGVDGTAGDAGPAVGFAPVIGAGLVGLVFQPGFGLDLGGQILADPDGLHAHTFHLAVLVGGDQRHLRRLGVSFVDDEAAGAVWWLTFGLADLASEH